MSKTIEQLQAENKDLRKKIKEQESLLHSLSSFVNNTKEIFWQMNFSLEITCISPSITSFLDYGLEEYSQQSIIRFLSPESAKKFLDLKEKFIKNGKTKNISGLPEFFLWDIKFVDKDGITKPATIKFNLFYDQQRNNPAGIQGSIFFDNQTKNFFSEILKMKSLFNLFFSQSVEGVFLMMLPKPVALEKKTHENKKPIMQVLENLVPVGYNDVLLKQFQISGKEFSKFRLTKVFNTSSYLDFWEKLFNDGKIPIRQLMKNKNGKPVAVEGEYLTLYNDAKEIIGIFGIQRDITDSFLLKKTTENEPHLKKLWDKANFAIFVVQNEKIVFWNKAAFDIISPKIEKNKEFKFSELVYEEDLPLIYERYSKRIRGEDVESTYNFRIKTAQNEIRWLQLHSAFYLWNGQPATLNFARDITDEIALKKQLKITNHHFEILSKKSSEMIAIYDGINLVYLSENTKKILGYTPEYKTIFDFENYIHPEDKDRIKREIGEIVAKQETHTTLVYRIKHASGKYLWLEVFINAKYENGQLGENIAVARNITDRKKLEEEIREKEALYRLLSENSSDGVSLYEYGKLVYQSPGRKKMLGQTPDIKTLEDAFKYIHTEDVQRVKKAMAKVIKKRLSSYMIQYRVKHYDGHYIWIEVLANIEYDKEKNPYRIIFKTRDVTSRKILEERIRKNEAQYRLLAENSTDGVALFENGELVYISPSYAKILGSYPEISRIEEMFDYIHPEDLPGIKQLVEKIKANKIEREISRYRIRKNDGTYVWFEDIIHSEFDENGNQTRIILNSRDVTSRVEAQRKLIEKEKQLQLLLNNMSDFLFLIDKGGIIKYTTPYTLFYFGFTEDETIGKSFFEFIYPPDLERLISDFSEAVRDKTIKQKLYRVTKKDGSFFWMEVTGNAIENELLDFVIVGRDVSERIQFQEQIKQQHKELVELNATKDKFFSILAHDLRSPFNQILGFSDLLRKNIHKYDTDKIAHFLGIIRNSSVKAYQLLENLLNWSLAKRGMMEFYPVTINIIPLVKEEINRFSEQIKTKNINMNAGDLSNLILTVDENMFRIIIRNIINNAIKFTPMNGKISVDFEEKKDEIIIQIKDNGTGMETKQIRSLFKLSENRSTEGTNNEKGTGLGLLVVKEFIDKHYAKIEIKSQKGKGTEIQLVFPKNNTAILS